MARNIIQIRRGYSTDYAGDLINSRSTDEKWLANSTLSEGEIGYEIDTGKFKIGKLKLSSGVWIQMPWSELPYAGAGGIVPGSGIGIEYSDSVPDKIYSILMPDDNNVTIDEYNITGILPNATGTYYKLGLSDNLDNINNINISGNLNAIGNIISNNIDLTDIVNKLVPPPPPTFAGSALSLSLSPAPVPRKLCSGFTPSNNGNNKTFTNGEILPNVIFYSPYNTNTISNVGPGESGTVLKVIKNTAEAGSRTLTNNNDAGTYLDLSILVDQDYNAINTNVAFGFYNILNIKATGLSALGWNTVYISGDRPINTDVSTTTSEWYYDNSNTLPVVGAPVVSTGVGSIFYSSSVPHFSGNFSIGFTAQHLSSDTYLDSVVNSIDNNDSTNAITNISTRNRTSYGLSNIAPRNDAQSAISLAITGVTPANQFRSVANSSFSAPLVVQNSFGVRSANIVSNGTVLIKTLGATNTLAVLREDNIPVGNSVQLGGDYITYGARISGYPVGVDTPASGTLFLWNSEAILSSGDCAIVGGILSHNITNYASHIPSGPNLSVAPRANNVPQYFTFKFQRSGVSTLKITLTTNGTTTGIAGLWFKLPNTAMDSQLASHSNGWARASATYFGGIFSSSNDGCAQGTVVPLNTTINNLSYNITFGASNSTNSLNNEIHVRIKLSGGQSISSLNIQGTS